MFASGKRNIVAAILLSHIPFYIDKTYEKLILMTMIQARGNEMPRTFHHENPKNCKTIRQLFAMSLLQEELFKSLVTIKIMRESSNAAAICCLPLEIIGNLGLWPAAPAANNALYHISRLKYHQTI